MSISSTISYDTAGNFIFDSNKIEISGGLARMIDQRQTGATFGATYTSSINGNWGDGVLTGTATGGATVSGGKLDLTGSTTKYVDYNADLNADSQQIGCFRFRITPNYTGAPATGQILLHISESAGSANNLLSGYHFTDGQLRITIYNS